MRLFWFLAALLFVILGLGALPTEAQVANRLRLPLVPKDPTPTATPTPTPAPVRIRYRAYVQNEGWLGWQENNSTAGTTDRGLRMEAFAVEMTGGPPNASVVYRAHVGGRGWGDWVRNGATAGTTTEGLPVEAIQIGLENVGPNAYVSYQAYAGEWGWLGHVRDLWIAGTTGQGRRLEAFAAYIRNDFPEPAQIKIAYNGNTQDRGYTGWKRCLPDDCQVAGITGEQLRLESFRVLLYNKPENMSIEYRAYVEARDWQGWVRDGDQAGTFGEGKKIYAFEMRFINPYPGTVLSYGGHFENRGWVEYASDNQSRNNPVVGNPGDQLRLEGLRVGLGNAQRLSQ